MLFYASEQFHDHPVKFIKACNAIQLSAFAKKDNQAIIDKFNERLKTLKANRHYQKINQECFHTHSQEVSVQ